jgi:hypothetical protein
MVYAEWMRLKEHALGLIMVVHIGLQWLIRSCVGLSGMVNSDGGWADLEAMIMLQWLGEVEVVQQAEKGL